MKPDEISGLSSSHSASWLILLTHLLAFWSLWPWYIQRLADGGDAPWGLLSLITAVVFVILEARNGTAAGTNSTQGISLISAVTGRSGWPINLIWSAGLTLLYAASYVWLPPLARACLTVTALTATVSVCFLHRRFHAGIWGLLLLSLPIMESLQFFAGYPLRTVVTMLAAALLSLSGLAVAPQGAALGWGNSLVAVDAPCSGIRMLWVGAYLVVALACLYRFGFVRLLVGATLSLAVLVLGNALRATALFYLEVGIIPAMGAAHTLIGIVVFALTIAAIIAVLEFLRRNVKCVSLWSF